MHINLDDVDSVRNVVDQCPNTPSNEAASSTGCSPSQKNSDSDGVLDSNDPIPLDGTEWLNTDGDTDGVLDVNVAFTLDYIETVLLRGI